MARIDLEYLLLFGVPENKIECIHEGRTRVCLAFPDREEAEEHFRTWLATLSRWQGRPAEDRGRVGAFEIELSRQRIDLLVPLNGTVLYNCGELTWMRGIWPGQTQDKEPSRWVKEFQLGFNLDEVFNYRVRFGHTELMLTPESMVRPAAYHFDAENPGGLVGQHYYQGVPDLVVEVVAPATESSLRADKMRLYREAGVRELWLVCPHREEIEVYRLLLERYASEGVFRPGQTFLSQGHAIDPADVFRGALGSPCLDLWPDEGEPVGLQQFLVAGIPLRRYEFYHGACPRLLAWEREEDAERQVAGLVEEIARWEEGVPGPLPFELGRFRLARNGSVLRLDVRVDGPTHRRFLDYWHFSGDWREHTAE